MQRISNGEVRCLSNLESISPGNSILFVLPSIEWNTLPLISVLRWEWFTLNEILSQFFSLKSWNDVDPRDFGYFYGYSTPSIYINVQEYIPYKLVINTSSFKWSICVQIFTLVFKNMYGQMSNKQYIDFNI